MTKEIEITFPNINVEEVRDKLEKLGLKNTKPRSFMKRKTFNFCGDIKCGRRRWARVRDESNKTTMTIKDNIVYGIIAIFYKI